MKKLIKSKYLIYIFLLIISVIFVVLNYKIENFWNITFKDILTFDIAIFFTFHLTQTKQDKRIKNEKTWKVIEDISFYTNEILKINFDSDDSSKQFTILIRKINNKINVLTNLHIDSIENEKINYISEQIKELEQLISEHIEDSEYLKKSKTFIEMHTNNVENKCDELFTDIFK